MHTQIWRFWKPSMDFRWSMTEKCRGNITFLIWWCGVVLGHRSAGKTAQDISGSKYPGTTAPLTNSQTVLFRCRILAPSLKSLLSTELVFLTHSQLSQSQLQHRVTVVLTGLESKDNTQGNHRPPELDLRVWPAFIRTSLNNCVLQGWALWKARSFSLYPKTSKVLTPVFPVGGWLLCKLETVLGWLLTAPVRVWQETTFLWASFSSSSAPPRHQQKRTIEDTLSILHLRPHNSRILEQLWRQ